MRLATSRSSRAGVIALATALAFLVQGTTPASAAGTPVSVSVGASCIGTGQLCLPASPAGTYDSLSPLSVTYTAAGTHCSNVALHLLVDGKDLATTGFAPPAGSTSATVPWPKDGLPHALSAEGEGQTGGCNSGSLGSWAGTLTIVYTPAPEKCLAESSLAARLSGEADQCCSIAATAHATRENTDVLATLKVVSGGTARCKRNPVDATLDGQFVRLVRGEGRLTLRATRQVCDDTVIAHVRQGSLSTTDEAKIPDSTPKITFRATRDPAGKVVVEVIVRHVLPTARCERPKVTVDGTLLRISVSGSTATAHRTVIGADSCATLAKLQYRQDQVTAQASREVIGALPTICHAPPP